MRASKLVPALFVVATVFTAFTVAGCGTDEGHGGGGMQDMSVAVGPSPDMVFLKPPMMCSMTDNLGDGMACTNGNMCPTGQRAVLFGGSCKCFTTCDTNNQATCPCDRFCDSLTVPDGGSAGGACLPANTPGERCFKNANGVPYGNGICQQGTACVRSDQAGTFRYCMYLCPGGQNSSCPMQTQCEPLIDPVTGNHISDVCALQHAPTAKMLGDACSTATDSCVLGALCDGTTCKTQCDGPMASCPSGTTCTAVTDGSRTYGYVCK